MRRRALLLGLTVALLALAGCSASASLSLDPAPDASTIADHAADQLHDLDAGQARLVREAVRGNAPTADGQYPPFESHRPIEFNGSFYNVSWSIVETRTVEEFVIDIEADPTNTSGSRIAYQDLPAVDRQTLPDLNSPLSSGQKYVNPAAIYNATERDRSVLVPSPEYRLITVEDRLIRVSSVEVRDETVNTYRYAVAEVAPSEDAFARQLRSEHLFTLSNLSSAEQDIVDSAIEDTQYADSDSEDGWAALTKRFNSQAPVYSSSDTNGEYLVRYDGTVYWAEFSSYIDPPE